MSTCDIAALALSPADRDALTVGWLGVVLLLAALAGSPGLRVAPRDSGRPMPPRHARVAGRRPANALCAQLDAEVEWGVRS